MIREKKENNIKILGEVILHVIVLAVGWFWMNKFLKGSLEKILKVTIKEQTITAIEMITALALIGLQKNLIHKLEYITLEHPFRIKIFSINLKNHSLLKEIKILIFKEMDNLRTSTMTACGGLNATINLNNFLNNLFPNDFIQFIETNKGNKGYAKKLDKKKEK